jgi:hypothetical protein
MLPKDVTDAGAATVEAASRAQQTLINAVSQLPSIPEMQASWNKGIFSAANYIQYDVPALACSAYRELRHQLVNSIQFTPSTKTDNASKAGAETSPSK